MVLALSDITAANASRGSARRKINWQLTLQAEMDSPSQHSVGTHSELPFGHLAHDTQKLTHAPVASEMELRGVMGSGSICARAVCVLPGDNADRYTTAPDVHSNI